MFDCHAHLTDPSLMEGLDGYLAEAEAAGVAGIVTVSESVDDATKVRNHVKVRWNSNTSQLQAGGTGSSSAV